MIKHNIAIIAAAGSGSRMSGNNSKKQFINIEGYPVLYYSIKEFCKCDFIDKIILTAKPDQIEDFETLLNEYNFEKDIQIVEGGKTRQKSIFNALEQCKNGNWNYVFIHDGARPFITEEIIKNGFSKMISEKIDCGAFGVKVKDTIKKSENGIISETVDREYLYSIQTPQIFLLDKYLKYMDIIKKENLDFTDDCQTFEYFNEKIMILDGSYENIKITTDDDIIMGNAIMKRRNI